MTFFAPAFTLLVEDVEQAAHVDVGIVERIARRDRDGMLRGVMADDVRFELRNIFAIDASRMSASMNCAFCVTVFTPSAAVFPERIDDEHVVPERDVRIDNMRSDEPSPASDDDSHVFQTFFCVIEHSEALCDSSARPRGGVGRAATAPLPLDQRITIASAIVVLTLVIGFAGTSRALRVLVLLALVCGAADAWWQRPHEPQVSEMRTARYTGVVLGDEQVGAAEPGSEKRASPLPVCWTVARAFS